MAKRLTAAQALSNSCSRHALAGSEQSIESIAGSLVGLHNTSPVSPYLSVRARTREFDRADLEELMFDEWQLARFRAMRLTMFVFPRDLLEIAAAATRHLTGPLAERWLRASGMTRDEFEGAAAAVTEALADGPLTVRGLRAKLGFPTSVDLPGVVGRMCDAGRLVGGAPPRHWRSSIREYHLWHDVLPDVDLGRWEEAGAIRELVARYVDSYGPVSIDDISWWTGITKTRCRIALDDLAVEEVIVEGWPGPLYGSVDTATGEVPTQVRALPLLDPYVQGYRDRVRLLDPQRHNYVYDGGGNATATLVHRGRVIGVWQVGNEPVASVRYHLFAGGPASVRRKAEAELAAAGALYFGREADVVEETTMKPLDADGGRSAAHPLDSRLHRASRRGLTR